MQRAIKAAKLRERLAPMMEALLSALAEWELEEGGPFLYDEQVLQVQTDARCGRPRSSSGSRPRDSLLCLAAHPFDSILSYILILNTPFLGSVLQFSTDRRQEVSHLYVTGHGPGPRPIRG